jgi:MHS family proline/betaine transporter-like MFS transporter
MADVAATATHQIDRGQWRVIILSSLGGALEFYDFVVFSTFAQYLSGAFFPSSDPTTGLLKTFITFAAGYVARPVGGLVFSHFGDKYGRRPVFIIAMLLMSVATVGIGLLPGYAFWGIAAPIGLVLLRILQGLSLGGELPGAITYVLETAPRRGGFVAGFVFFCVNTGVAIAAILNLTLQHSIGSTGIAAGGWRIGFIVGGLLGIVSFWLRLSLEETTEYKKLKHLASKRPFAELMKSAPVAALVGVGALTCTAGFNGLLFAMPSFLPTVMHYTPAQAAGAQNVGLLVLSFGLLTTAWLGDRMPRRYLLGFGAFIMMILAFPFFSALAARSMNLYGLFALAGLAASFVNGPMCALVGDLYPTRLRFSGVAVSFNLAFSIFTGIAPLAATYLARAYSLAAPAYYMAGCAFITLVATLVVKHFDGRILDELTYPTSSPAPGSGGAIKGVGLPVAGICGEIRK